MTDKHLMVDIETMSTRENASILSIGWVFFDPRGMDDETTLNGNIINIALQGQEDFGRHISGSTVIWWLQQEKAAQDNLTQGEQMGMRAALTKFRMSITKAPIATRCWAKSPDFDIKILNSAFSAAGEMWPSEMSYSACRCVRTITELAYPEGDAPQIGVGVAHNALDDAKRQVLMVQHCHAVLNA